jgi:hypothetical protein
MKLPNAANAVVDIAKLRDYCLNPNHPKGKHKARAFLDKLGLERNDAELLRKSILEAILKLRRLRSKQPSMVEDSLSILSCSAELA